MKSSINNIAALVLRIAGGSLMLTHCIPKLSKLATFPDVRFADPLGIGAPLGLVLVLFAEVICSSAVIVGFKTKLASIPIITTMAVVVFIHKAGSDFGSRELPLAYLCMFVVIGLLGSGNYSLDKMMGRKG